MLSYQAITVSEAFYTKERQCTKPVSLSKPHQHVFKKKSKTTSFNVIETAGFALDSLSSRRMTYQNLRAHHSQWLNGQSKVREARDLSTLQVYPLFMTPMLYKGRWYIQLDISIAARVIRTRLNTISTSPVSWEREGGGKIRQLHLGRDVPPQQQRVS